MLIIRKRTVIKFFSLLFGTIVFILGLLFRGYSLDKNRKNDKIKRLSAFYTSVCASLENICTSFDDLLVFNDKNDASKNIYSNCMTAKNSIYFCDVDMPNTLLWFSDLAEYTETDMTDSSLNDYYFQTALQARNLFVSLCADVENIEKKNSIEKLFDPKDSDYYNIKLERMNSGYNILGKFIDKKRNEINKHAKKILNFPITHQKNKGLYSDPPLCLYSTENSYAHIFTAGGILKRMSVDETSNIEHIFGSSLDNLAKEYLNEYAPYAQNCEKIYSFENTELMYYVFCPVVQQKSTSFVDFTESIKLAVSLSDGKLMAFDASSYLKNHSDKEYPNVVKFDNRTKSNISEEISLISEGIIYTDKGYFSYGKYDTPDGRMLYRVCDFEGKEKTFGEKAFMLCFGIM